MTHEEAPRESLAAILQIERSGGGGLSARLEDFWGQSLGGDALARAALAASESCGDRELHALHGCVLRSAPAGVDLALDVERLGEDDGLARRRVRLEEDDGRVSRLRSYGFCPETVREGGEELGFPVRTGPYRFPTPGPGRSFAGDSP